MKVLYLRNRDPYSPDAHVANLRAAGHEVVAPALPDAAPRRLTIARSAAVELSPDVVVGAGTGGGLAMAAADAVETPPRLVLLAPAWRAAGVEPRIRASAVILHGIKDAVVPLADSVYLEDACRLPPERLIPVNDDHSLSLPFTLALLRDAVRGRVGSVVRSQIRTIRPYLYHGTWVFDDPAAGLDKEALVAGVPEIIALATARAGIPNPERGFVVLFSDEPFPESMLTLTLAREDGGGHVYFWPETGLEGWLCPALFRYFDAAPPRLYVGLRRAGG